MTKNAIITGGAKGIGKKIANTLASSGIRVILFDFDEEALKNTASEMRDSGLGDLCDWSVIDISNIEQTKQMVAEVYNTWGSIDILVNNAGILSKSNILEVDEAEWNRVMDINVKGSVFMTQYALEYMARNKHGSIINISSLAGRNGGFKTGTVYSISKAAIIGLTKRTARFASTYGISVNAIAPGTTDTEMAKGFTPEEMESLIKTIPMGQLVKPDEIAEAVLFLTSEKARSITGTVLDINGGMYM